jgi:signal transduction histidine kinase
MSGSSKPSWERFGDAMVGWCGYLLLVPATVICLLSGPKDVVWQATTLGIVALTASWIYLMFTRLPPPRQEHPLRVGVFFVGVLVLASVLMLRHPLFFIFMISGFFYASVLRPLPLAFVGVFATSFLVNTLIAGFPQTDEAWTFYIVIIAIQTVVIGGGAVLGERISEQNEERRQALARLEVALEENAGLHAQLLAQAREAGIMDERQRMAREIHDTIAQGLTGIVTQLEAANHASDRPEERQRHVDTAARLARDSLAEARRAVEASRPPQLDGRSLLEAVTAVADEWTAQYGLPVEVSSTGEAVPLHPEIELALLRIAQEALANVAKHAGATRARLTLSYMGDVVTLDIRDDGVGFVPPTSTAPRGLGFGLSGMRQRANRVAGTLSIESEPGGGTAISARVPAIASPPSGASA